MPGLRLRRTLSAAGATVLTVAAAIGGTAPATAAKPSAPSPPPPARASASPRSAGTVRLTASSTPVATLTAAPNVPRGTGPVRNGTFASFELSETLRAQVNVGSGNLLLSSRDLTLPGIAADLPLGAVYNSLLVGSGVDTGAFGPGWRTATGSDVRLVAADDGTVTYLAAGGVAGVFTPTSSGAATYTSPGEFKGTLTKVTGAGWTLQEDASGRRLTFTTAGTLDKWTDRNGGVTDLVLDAAGREREVVSTRGGTNSRKAAVTYTSAGLISSYVQTGDDTTARATTYAYTGGRLSSITRPTTRAAQFGYDGAGNVTSIVVTAGWGTVRRTTLTYDAAHRVTSLTRVTDTATGAGATTRFAYPSTTQTLQAGADTDLSAAVASAPHTTYTVDADKRVTATADPAGYSRSVTYTPFKDVSKFTGAEGGSVSNVYGANGGRSLTATYPSTSAAAGASTATYGNAATAANPTANFQPSAVKDRNGDVTAYTYNGPGNLATGTGADSAAATVTYNADGTVATSKDPANGNNATVYHYDSGKQLTSITPVTGSSLATRTFTYDTWGRLHTATDGAGRTTTYDYDYDDHPVSISYSDGTLPVDSYYDAAGNVYQRDDGHGTVRFGFDLLNRLVSRSATSGGGDLAYGYDPAGNLTSLSDGRGTTTYTYDDRDLLIALTTANGTRYAFDYDHDGRRTVTYFKANAAKTTWAAKTVTGYDPTGRITRVATTRNSAAPVTVADVSACYTPFAFNGSCAAAAADKGRVQWEYDHLTSARSDYTYNTAGRLTAATNVGGSTWSYTYDANGNRRTVTRDGSTQTLAYNAGNEISTTGNTYDGAGNQLTGAGQNHETLGYNAAGQMTGSGAHPYQYSGADQTELVRADHTNLVYGAPDEFGQPWIQSYVQHYDDGDQTTGYIERDPTGQPLGVEIDGVEYFYGVNRLGSIASLVDTAGSVAASYTYDPYGGVTAATGARAEDNPLRFTGAFQDTLYGTGTAFTKLGVRWYNGGQGRFTQPDSINVIGDPLRATRYAYATGDPVNRVDPLGLFDWGALTNTWAKDTALGALGGCIAAIETGCVAGAAAGATGGFVTGAIDGLNDGFGG
jgi:RHS repeat-associated protein